MVGVDTDETTGVAIRLVKGVPTEKIELSKQTGYSRSWVAETMKRLQEQGIIKRVGSDKTGHWEIIG